MADPIAPALVDAYRDWFQLAADHAAGRLIPNMEFVEALALIREAESLCPARERDVVYLNTRQRWIEETGLDPILGTPLAKEISHA